MSEAHIETTGLPHLSTADINDRAGCPQPAQRSFLESFLDSFFQEKNIKWMLVVGAAIVFGSSLMLVTKEWAHWNNALKFMTILGYTGVIFGAAEVSRRRLGLTATYKVLHSLTLLLLPVCFLALQWLTAGTATQVWDVVEICGLLLPATAFLWFASSRILDHMLRGRQTTFLISFCVLCIAGAFPVIHSAGIASLASTLNFSPETLAGALAFAFMTVCWLVFTAGVMKVNRHTFWLAEEHRLPRVFGFLPVAILGLQFVVLIGTKAITAIPVQWMGFDCMMVAATILMTARTVADVFRQRTGDLVRPLPWHIVVPLFSGLVLTALGLALSFKGFTYVGDTTYAVVPAAIVATVLMWIAARDTRHSGFVWASLICAAIAYQCAPTLFADVIRAVRETTAEAINRERVPFSLYGVTYLPLLGLFAVASRWFVKRGDIEFSKPLKHFVTAVGLSLFCVALTDHVSLFFVSLSNVAAFIGFAIAFQDRRYVMPSLAGLVTAAAVAIPALNSMAYTDIPVAWVPTVMAGLAVLMTATRLPDRILNTIPLSADNIVCCRDQETGQLTQRSVLLQTAAGGDRHLCQLIGCVLAAVVSVQWVGSSINQFSLTQASLLQYVFLMTAFVLYTLRNPRYLSGLCFWGMAGFAAVRWAAGLNVAMTDVLSAASFVTATTSLLGYLWLKGTGQISAVTSLGDLRRQLGFDPKVAIVGFKHEPTSGGWIRQAQAFVVPLCDLSLVILTCLAAAIHLPLLLKMQLDILSHSTVAAGSLWLSTTVTVLWLTAATIVFRSRAAGVASTMILPLWVTAAVASLGIPLTASWCPIVWASVAGIIFVISSLRMKRSGTSPVLSMVTQVSDGWLLVLLIFSCLSFDIVLRLAAAICLGCYLLIDGKHLDKSRTGFLAITANIHVLMLAAAVGGCSGLVASVLMRSSAAAIPFVFFVSAISVAIFDRNVICLDRVLAQTWTALLRTGMIVLAVLSLAGPVWDGGLLTVMMAGFAVAAVTEIVQAVRRQQETHVWSACGVVAMAALFLFDQGIISFGVGLSQFVLLGLSVVGLSLAHVATRREDLAIIRRPMHVIGQTLPTLVALLAIGREVSGYVNSSTALNAMALMISAGIYFQQAMVHRKRSFAIMAAAIMNVGLMLLWRSLHYTALEFYLVPVGLSVLAFVELLKKELPKSSHDPLRYIGALTILVSPLFEVLDGSWGHMLTLMVLSVMVILVAIGLRIRVLVYAGSAFVLADLVAMVVHSTIANPALLWVGGVALGVGVIALAAVCENHREKLLARIRFVSAELATWN